MSLVQDGPTYSRPVCIPDSCPSRGNSSCSHSDRKASPYQYPCWDDCGDPNSRPSDPSQVVSVSRPSHAPSRRRTRLRPGQVSWPRAFRLIWASEQPLPLFSRSPHGCHCRPSPLSSRCSKLGPVRVASVLCLPVTCPCPAIYFVEIMLHVLSLCLCHSDSSTYRCPLSRPLWAPAHPPKLLRSQRLTWPLNLVSCFSEDLFWTHFFVSFFR